MERIEEAGQTKGEDDTESFFTALASSCFAVLLTNPGEILQYQAGLDKLLEHEHMTISPPTHSIPLNFVPKKENSY